jgi:hypothetical protein
MPTIYKRKALKNGNELQIAESSANNHGKWCNYINLRVAEMKPDTNFVKANGKNVVSIKFDLNFHRSDRGFNNAMIEAEKVFDAMH